MIKIYGKPTCVFCVKAKKLAEQYGLKYEYLDIEVSDNLTDLKKLVPEVKTVPQIFWDLRYIGGYQEFATEIQDTIGGYGDGIL